MSTFNLASWRAIVIFSRLPKRVPAACSPSLKVVSNTAIFDVAFIPTASILSLGFAAGGEQPIYSSIPQESEFSHQPGEQRQQAMFYFGA
jgi:hypothetical protein